MSGTRRLLVVSAAVALVLLALRLTLDSGQTGPRGPAGSSYATSPAGLGGYAELLQRAGHPVERVRFRPREAVPSAGETAVLVDPDVVSADDAAALRRFVTAGGRLIVADRNPETWIDGLLDRAPTWRSGGDATVRVLVPVAETSGVATISTARDGVFASAGGTLPIVAGQAGVLAAVGVVGRGRVVLIADASPLANDLLGDADNAAFGLAIAGAASRRVAFYEAVHGYGRGQGFSALPRAWRMGLGVLLLAGLALIWARGRRFGPPEQRERALPPARRRYPEAMAQVLVRASRDGTAAENVREAAAALARRRPGVLTADESAAIETPITSTGQALVAGRALARLQRKDGE